MKTRKVEELMVPLDEYASVTEDASLYDAVMALEQAQEDFVRSPYRHRAVIIMDKNRKVVGKVSQMDILRALEPQYDNMIEKESSATRFGFSRQFQKSMMDWYKLWDAPMQDICNKATSIKVNNFMSTPKEGEHVEASVSLNEAINQMVMGHHQSLLVTNGSEIVGVLRLADVFMSVFEAIKTCKTGA